MTAYASRGDWTSPRTQFLQELKATRLEKVKFHREQGFVGVTSNLRAPVKPRAPSSGLSKPMKVNGSPRQSPSLLVGSLTVGTPVSSAPAPGKAPLSSLPLAPGPDLDKARPTGPKTGGAPRSVRPLPSGTDLNRKRIIKGESGQMLKSGGA